MYLGTLQGRSCDPRGKMGVILVQPEHGEDALLRTAQPQQCVVQEYRVESSTLFLTVPGNISNHHLIHKLFTNETLASSSCRNRNCYILRCKPAIVYTIVSVQVTVISFKKDAWRAGQE